MPNKNLGQIVAAAWDKYVGADAPSDLFQVRDNPVMEKERVRRLALITDITGGEDENSGLIRDIRRSNESFWRPTQHQPNVMITSPETFSKYEELLTGLGKVSQRRLNAYLFSDGTGKGKRLTHGLNYDTLDTTRADVFDSAEFGWDGVQESSPEQKIQLELSQSLEKMLTT